MLNKNLIFSDNPGTRLKRHLLFWLLWWMYFGLMHAVIPMGIPEISYMRNLPYTLSESILILLPQVFTVYPIMYFVLPRFFLMKKYIGGILWSIVFIIITSVVILYMTRYINPRILHLILPGEYFVAKPRSSPMNFAMSLLVAMKGGLTVVGLAVSMKLMKYWYQKEQRNLELSKQNTEVQLQLLTARVNPHFLFNTLNNIYSKTQHESPGGARMMMELSHIMRYIIDEGPKTIVPLENDLEMVKNYVQLEKIRYDNKLDLFSSYPADAKRLQIAPLLLIPFVENCFKHGASNMLENPWINIKFELKANQLVMKLINGKKPGYKTPAGRTGKGIDNVKKRLELIYPGNYTLDMRDEEDVFIVNLTIQLSELVFTAPKPKTELYEFS